jgi:hypothetical protein
VEQALLIGCLLLSLGLTWWAAATLGRPVRSLPRRPLPPVRRAPVHQRVARLVDAQRATARFYVGEVRARIAREDLNRD